MRNMMKTSAFAGLMSLFLLGAPQKTFAADTVRIQLYKAGFIVGVSGGRGTLSTKGRNYPLTIGGVSLGATIGASRADLVGRVYNLTKPSDIEGTYSAAQAGVAVAGGGKAARLTNSRGVILEVRGKQIGLEFSVDLSGMQVGIKR